MAKASRRLNHKSSTRRAVWDASGGKCHHCGKDLHPFADFHVDHLIPLKHGGPDALDNLVASCVSCNLRGAGRPLIVKVRKRPGKGMDGNDLRRRREELGMTQTELARLLVVYQTTISQWENGRREIRHARILALALRALEQEQEERIDDRTATIDPD